MMNFCVRFGSRIVNRSDGLTTALFCREGAAGVPTRLVQCCYHSWSSASISRTNSIHIVAAANPAATGAGTHIVRARLLPVMRPAALSRPLHTSVHRHAEDPTAAVDNKHLQLTAAAARESVLARGTVTRVWQASSSVLCFAINVDHPDFKFKAGQWVDIHIPGMETVGGFSLCNAPHQFAADGCITLGIKRSEWPPSKWFHQNCAVGNEVELRVGGDFFLDLEKSPDPLPRLLLVAGGVGVNPLLSMMHHLDHLSARQPRATLLFSARTQHDLLYKRELDELCGRNSTLKVRYFLTRTPAPQGTATAPDHHRGRIGRPHLIEALVPLTSSAPQAAGASAASTASSQKDTTAVSFASSLTSENALPHKDDLKNIKVCICGPPSMINDVVEILLEVGVPKNNLLYEKWW